MSPSKDERKGAGGFTDRQRSLFLHIRERAVDKQGTCQRPVQSLQQQVQQRLFKSIHPYLLLLACSVSLTACELSRARMH